MPPIVSDIFGLLGHLLAAVGFLVFGFAGGKFTVDSYHKATWQVQIALALGFFGLLVGLADFASPGSAGAFALGAGFAFMAIGIPGKKADNAEENK